MKENSINSAQLDFFNALDYSKFKIKAIPPFIFLCGGISCENTNTINFKNIKDNCKKCELKCTHSDDTKNNQSLRQIFTRYHDSLKEEEKINAELIYAEKIAQGNWQVIKYSDLLDLELDISYLVGSIPLFIESAGSFAELGSFVVLNNIVKKLIPIVKSKFHNDKQQSFISSGLLRYYENLNNQKKLFELRSYSFDSMDDIKYLYSDIKSEMEKKCNISFDKKDERMLAPLVYDIIYLFQCVTRAEIRKIIESSNFCKNKERVLAYLNKILYTLKAINLIREEAKGETYYVANKEFTYFMSSDIISSEKLNKQRIKLYDLYEEQRKNIIDSITQKSIPTPEVSPLKIKKEKNKELLESISDKTSISKDKLIKEIIYAPKRYKNYNIKKKNGKKRLISQPPKDIKIIQRALMRILEALPVHSSCVAYKKGSNGILENAKFHNNKKFILKMDFKDFFPSITSKVVFNYIKMNIHKVNIEYNNLNTFLLLSLLLQTNKRSYMQYLKQPSIKDISNEAIFKRFLDYLMSNNLKLSVGAPTSPFISNVILYDFDIMIANFCKELNVSYSRYADDLTFSSNEDNVLNKIQEYISELLKEEQFNFLKINYKKTRSFSKKYKQEVTGLVLATDGGITIGKSKKKHIKLMLKLYNKKELDPNKVSHLKGMLSFLYSIEPSYYKQLKLSNIDLTCYELFF